MKDGFWGLYIIFTVLFVGGSLQLFFNVPAESRKKLTGRLAGIVIMFTNIGLGLEQDYTLLFFLKKGLLIVW